MRILTAIVIAAATLSSGRTASAQTVTYKARLAPVPVANLRDGITGLGSATAALAGRSLTVRGTFDGMKSSATIAQIHLGPRGIRGPVMFDLMVTKGTSGTLTGTFTLTPEQVEAVKAGRFYIQVHSESAPDGNLWGWLLP
jgi:CHRD domain-containing protein